ncbi:MAG: hypothetical protein KF819_27840 [Labilithrix sp.]|nr:hypothetical protein [Labilithrix sp.]
MDFRGVLLTVAASSAAIFAVGACSGPDPGLVEFVERPRGVGEIPSGGPIPDGSAPTDAGGDAPVVADPVFGTTTFAAGTPGPGAPAKAANMAHGGDSSGQDCVVAGCHIAGGNRQWTFAGTLYADGAGGAARVAGAEIRISRPDGTEFAKTYSDADGNFWIDDPLEAIPAGSRVGVRNATLKMNMAGAIGAGQAGCSQAGTCHGGTALKVYLK